MRGPLNKVELTDEERDQLEELLRKGIHPARQIKRARILLALDEMWRSPKRRYKPTQGGIADACGVNPDTVYKISKQYAKEGMQSVLTRKKSEKPPRTPICTGEIEARIIALACGPAPEGYSRWTLRLLESKVVELGIVDQISDTTIYRLLKKRLSSPT